MVLIVFPVLLFDPVHVVLLELEVEVNVNVLFAFNLAAVQVLIQAHPHYLVWTYWVFGCLVCVNKILSLSRRISAPPLLNSAN